MCAFGDEDFGTGVVATVGAVSLEEVVGGFTSEQLETAYADGVIRSGCGEKTCGAEYTAGLTQVVAFGFDDADAPARLLAGTIPQILAGAAGFDLARLGPPD